MTGSEDPRAVLEPVYKTSCVKSTVFLKFNFGYWCLHAHPLLALVVSEHFINLPEHPLKSVALASFDREVGVFILSGHPIRKKLRTLEISSEFIRYVTSQYSRHYVEIKGEFRSYLKGLPRKGRHELRRKMRRFRASGQTCFREYRSASEIGDFYQLAVELSRQTFQNRIGASLPETPEYVAELVQKADQDEVRGYILFKLNRPVAFYLCRVNGNCITTELCGYDPDFKRWSPGIVLTTSLLEHLFRERRFEMLDFGSGGARYKAFFSTGHKKCADVYYFGWNLRNVCLIGAHCTIRGAWWCTAKVLDTVGLRIRLKKLFRHGWARQSGIGHKESAMHSS